MEATVFHGQFALFQAIGAPVDVLAILAAAVLAFLLRGKAGFGWAATGAVLLGSGPGRVVHPRRPGERHLGHLATRAGTGGLRRSARPLGDGPHGRRAPESLRFRGAGSGCDRRHAAWLRLPQHLGLACLAPSAGASWFHPAARDRKALRGGN